MLSVGTELVDRVCVSGEGGCELSTSWDGVEMSNELRSHGQTFPRCYTHHVKGVKLLRLFTDKEHMLRAETTTHQSRNEEDMSFAAPDLSAAMAAEGFVEAGPDSEILSGGNVLRLSFVSSELVAKMRRQIDGFDPLSRFSPLLGRKRHQRLLYELVYDRSKISAAQITDVSLFKQWQCCKLGFNSARNTVLVEAFPHLIKEADAFGLLAVKPIVGSKPSRSTTLTDKMRGAILLSLFLAAVAAASLGSAIPAFKVFENVGTGSSVVVWDF